MVRMLRKLLSSGHWVPPMMVIKPLVALLPRQCNARRLVRPFREEPPLDLVVVVHRIHSMTLGTRKILGALLEAIAPQADSPLKPRTTLSIILLAVENNPTLRGQQAILLRLQNRLAISLTAERHRCQRRPNLQALWEEDIQTSRMVAGCADLP